MKKKYRKLLSLLTALCLVLSMTPLAALAAEGNGTLQSKIDAVTDSTATTIKLTDDVTESITISANKEITLDLAGHKITATADHTITNKGKLTIQDSVGGGVIESPVAGKSALQNEVGASATLESGKLYKSLGTNSSDYYAITNHGTMTINGGEVVSNSSHSSAIENGWYTASQNTTGEPSTLIINGGTVANNGPTANGGLYTLKNDDYGVMEINGGTFTNTTENAGTLLNWNVATINGGTFNAENVSVATMAEGEQGTPTHTYEKGETTILGGTFHAPLGGNEQYSAAITVSIKGGTFVADVSEYVADGYICTRTDGGYTVAPLGAENAVAQVGNHYYRTLAEAIETAGNQDTVKLLKDTAVAATITVEKGITLDLGGHILTIENSDEETPAAAGLLFASGNSTLTNGTVFDARSKDNTAAGYITVYVPGDSNLTTSNVTIQTYQPNTEDNYNYLLRAQAQDGKVGSLTLKSGTVIEDLDKTNASATTYGAVGVAVLGPSSTKDYSQTENLTIEDGVKIKTMGYAIAGNGTTHGTKIVIEGGSITSYDSGAIYHPQAGKLTMNGGTLTGLTGVQLCSGEGTTTTEFQLNGGTIRGTGDDEREDKGTGDGIVSDGAAISLVNRNYPGGAPSITINGGYFSSVKNDAVIAYTWGNGTSSEWTEAKKFLKVSGGYFTSNIKDYVVEGKAAIKGTYSQGGENYTYQVADKPAPAPQPVQVVSAVAEVSKVDGTSVTGEAVAVSVGSDTLKLTGKFSSGNKATVTYKTTADENAGKSFTVEYKVDVDKFVAEGTNLADGKLTVGEGDTATVYTVDLTGLELLPTEVAVAGGKPAAEIPTDAGVPDDYTKDKLETTKADGLEAAATEKIQSSTENETKGEVVLADGKKVTGEEGKTALESGGVTVTGETVTLVVQPYLDIKVKAYSDENDQKSLTLEIEPKYNVIATTKPDDIKTGEGSDKNAVPVATEQKMTVKNDVTIQIPIPKEMAQNADGSKTENLYIEHKKSDGKIYRYKAEVAGDDTAGYTATFTVPNGFSEFTVLVDARKGSLLFNSEGTSTLQEYTFADIGTELPKATATAGMTFSGWKIDGKVYASMTDELLTLLSAEGTPVAATPTFTTNGGGGGEEPEEWVNPFTDVKEKDWFYDAVKYTNQKSLFGGTAADKFSPEDTMTRGMLVTVLHRLEGEPVVSTKADFSDVKETEYYAKPVDWAAANKIVGGFAGKFNPEDAVTREEMAAILHRYAAYKGYDISATASLDSFRDGAKTSGWAVGDMKWAVGAGMIYGRENNTLAPGGTATRAEVAQIMMRFCEKFATK